MGNPGMSISSAEDMRLMDKTSPSNAGPGALRMDGRQAILKIDEEA